MTHFGFLKSRAVSLFSRTASRERRLENTRKSLARKILDQFLLEKMEDRWMPAVTVTTGGTGNLLFIQMDADNDGVFIQRTGGSGSDSVNITATNSLPISAFAGIQSISVFDMTGTKTGQSLVFQDGSIGNFVSGISSTSIETINISAKLNGSLSISGSASQIVGSVSNALASTVTVNNSNLTVVAPLVTLPSITATNSTLTLSAAVVAPSTVTATNSCVSVSGSIITDFSQTSITANGGTFSAAKDSKLNSLVLNAGASSPVAFFANASNATTVTLNDGSLVAEGNIQTLTQTGGTLTVRRSPGSVISTVDNPKIGTLTISGGTATIQDDATVSGVTTISGAGTNVTFQAGSLYHPTISTTTINNGTVSISNTTITGPATVNAGTVTMTDSTSNAILGLSGGVLTVTRGTYTGSVAASGGTLSINGATLNNVNGVNPVLSLSGANTTVFNSSISASAGTNAVEVSGASTFTVNMGNATTAGNNTFSILPGGSPYFIKNTSLNTISAIGNTWNFNGTAMPNSSPSDAFAIQNYIQGSGASASYGLVYFNAGSLYVLNNQQVTGINSISAVSDKAAGTDVIYIEGGSNTYIDNVQVVGKGLSFVGIANGTGTNPILGFNSTTVASPFFRFFEDPTTPVAITNGLANLTFDGTGLTPTEKASAILVDSQYFLAGSSLTLSGATTSTNFDTSTNPSLFQIAGGQLNVSTTGTLVGSLQFNPTVNSVFTLNSGSTVNGPLSISTVPSGVTFAATISGTLNGPTASPISLYGGTVTVTGTGTITGSPISIQGATFNLNGGIVTSAIQHDSGTLNITGGTSSGSVTITGGTTTISGGTFDASTATTPSAVNSVITITGGSVNITGGTVNADNSNTTYRDGVRIDGTGTGYIGSTVSISGLNVTLTPTNNISTAGIRVMGVNSTLYNAPNTVLTLGDGSTITNGDFSIVIGGVNSCLTGNKFGNLTLNNSDGTAFIKLDESAYFNDQTQVPFHLDASQITYNPFYSGPGGFRPADAPLGTPSNDQLQRLFKLESRIFDYTAGPNVGFVELYPGAGFAISGREIQRSINAVNTPNTLLYVQGGTYNESLTIDANKTGLQLIGPTSYGNITPATIAPVSGSNAALLVQADNVLITGFTISGANGTTPLLSNGQLSGTSYGVTNFNGTAATAIANLTVTNSVVNNFINAGVYLQDNGTKLASTVSDSSFTSIGVYGYNGGVVASGSFVAVSNNTMSKVTNGVVIRNVSTALTGSADITKNTIDAYATGITVQGYSSPSSFTIGGGSNFNALSLATGMNTTLPSPSNTDNTGLYLVGITGSAVPTIADNNVSGFSLGYYTSNITQPMTISGGSITSAFRGVIVAADATTNPNGGALGVGSSIANVTASGVSVSSLYTSGIAFRVVGVNSGTGPTLTLNSGTSYTASTAANTTAACITNRGIFVVNNASLVDNGSTANGIYNSNSSVTINSPASISNFKSGRYAIQQLVGGSTTINGGSIVGSGEQVRVSAGTLTINGGTISSTGSNNTLHFSGTTGTIGSSVGNTLITANSGSALNLVSGSLTITQGSNTTNLTSSGASVVTETSGGATLVVSGGNLYSSNSSATVVSITGGAANITGGTISNATVGVALASGSSLLRITGGTISGSASGVSVTAGNANISGGRISSPQIGVNFNSTGTLNVLSGSTSDITGSSGSGILILQGTGNINGGTISGSTVGINFNGATATGSVSGVTFIGGQSDLQLNQTNGAITLGINNSFSGSASAPGNSIGYILNKTTQNFLLDPSTRFMGTPLSSLSVPADLSTLYSIQDKIVDGLDNPAFGLVRLKAATLLMTTNSYYTPASISTATVQRGIDLSSSGDSLWVQSGTYPGGINTTGKTLTLGTGDGISVGPVDVSTGDLTFSSTTTLKVRLMGNTTGAYTQINMQAPTVPVDFSNAVISYSNENGFTPTVGDNFKVVNQILPGTAATSSRFEANVVGVPGSTVLQDQGRYQLAAGQFFATLYQGITGTNRNDFVLVSVPQFVTNVVVYPNWSTLYFGDPVNYVDPAGVTTQLTYGVTAAANITNGFGQLQVPSGAMGTISIANATYTETLGGYSSSNLTINVIGACSSTNTALGNVNGDITVNSINLNSCTTLNMRVNAGSGFTTFDQITTNGTIALNNAYGNFSFNGNFSNPGLATGDFLKLINNTNGTNVISGRFRYANGTTIINGSYFPVTGQSDKGFYSTYTLGTASPFDDFAMIYNYKHGSVPNVAVDQVWDTSNYDFGAFVTVGNTTYTIGIDAFGQMRDYTPAGGVTLVGGVAAVSPTGNIQIAAGTYNSTFTVDKGFTLTGPTTGNATFPAATGQTVLRGNSTSAANVTAGSWTNNLLFGNLLVGNGTIFDNAARLIDNNGSLYFQSGITFSNVSLSTGKSILISSNVAGSPATLLSQTGGTVVTVSGTNVNATLTDLVLGGTGRGVNMTNSGSVTFNNVTGAGSLSSIGAINGPTVLTLNYPLSTANNTLTVRGGSLNFTPLGTSNLSLSGQSGMTFNANIGTTATPAGNNTIVLAANSTFAGGVIATGSGVDAFTISAPQPMTVKGGGGNDTVSIAAANAYLSSYDGEAGVNTFRSGPNSVNYIDLGASGTGGAYLSRGNTTTRSAFANVAKVYGNGFTDIFSVTDNNAAFALVNGGNGNDQLNFNGTSGANATFDVTRQLQATISGASAGSVSYYNFANSTPTVSMIDSFISVENVKGGSGDDTIVMAYGGSLSGSLNGGAGNNTIDYSAFLAPTSSSITPGVRVDLTSGSATAIGGSAAYRVSNIRDIYGTVGFDILNGDAGNNIIDGGDGADSITGQAGNDILIGGLGADTVRGGTGDNIDIGGYVNFEGGGELAAYGIPAAYKPFVLRSMMNSWSTGNNTGPVFDSNANALSLTGVNVQVPGNTTSYTGIKLIAATSLTDPVKGTVFDDGQVDTLDMQSSAFNWIFVPQFPADNIINGTPRKVTYVYKLIP